MAASKENNEHAALWRSSANEGVSYSEDFTEALVTLPEFIDGALGAGKASQVDITIEISEDGKCVLMVKDNGGGITSVNRIKNWASDTTGDNNTENVYGHGSKKALAKFCPEYENAKWKLEWRKQDKKGVSGCLNTLLSPFKGPNTKHIDDNDEDETTCGDHGTKWTVNFNISVLGKYNTPKPLMQALKEIIRTRYEPSDYQPYTINVTVIKGSVEIKESSSNWKSLKETLSEEVDNGGIEKTHDTVIQFDNTTVKYVAFTITEDGRQWRNREKIKKFPKYGFKNMPSTRVHISRKGRYIEPLPYSKFLGKESHNSMNGQIGFVQIYGELPTPCTTKVKFQEECPIFKKMKVKVLEYIDNVKAEKEKAEKEKAEKKKAEKKKAEKAEKERIKNAEKAEKERLKLEKATLEPQPDTPKPSKKPTPKPSKKHTPKPSKKPTPTPSKKHTPTLEPQPDTPEPTPKPQPATPEPTPKPQPDTPEPQPDTPKPQPDTPKPQPDETITLTRSVYNKTIYDLLVRPFLNVTISENDQYLEIHDIFNTYNDGNWILATAGHNSTIINSGEHYNRIIYDNTTKIITFYQDGIISKRFKQTLVEM